MILIHINKQQAPGVNPKATKEIIFIVNIVRTGQTFIFFTYDQKKKFKGTLIQIWKPTSIFAFIWKYYVEDFTLRNLLLFEICKKSVYEHSETIGCVKN